MSLTPKKFLDASGVQYLADKLNDYPTNELLGTVIDAIGDELDTKANIEDIPEDKLFIVNVTLTSMISGTADQTAGKIKTAANNGKIPVVFTSYGTSTMRAFLAGATTTAAVFVYNDTGNSSNETARMTISSSGAVSITWKSLAPKDSPGFSGVPTAPTAASGTNSTQIATTAFVQSELNNLIIPVDINDLTDSNGIIPTDVSDLSDTTDLLNHNITYLIQSDEDIILLNCGTSTQTVTAAYPEADGRIY